MKVEKVLNAGDSKRKKSTPSWQVLQEYLFVNGFEWVKEVYGLSDEQIDSILYGGALPTEESNRKKIERVYNEDAGKGRSRMLVEFYRDHFMWDESNVRHLRCMNAEDEKAPIWLVPAGNGAFKEVSLDEFRELLTISYGERMKKDMRSVGNKMKSGGWSHGKRTINQTTSKTSDDVIQDIYLRFLENGKLYFEGTTTKEVKGLINDGRTISSHILLEEYEAGSFEGDDYENAATTEDFQKENERQIMKEEKENYQNLEDL